MKEFQPMLAGKADPALLRFPCLASPKLDGIRCVIRNGVALSRKGIPIPNQHVQKLFGRPELEGLDGELIVGSPTSPTCYRDTNSGVMTIQGEPDVYFYVFDKVTDPDTPFNIRLASTLYLMDSEERILHLGHTVVTSHSELDAYEAHHLDLGYEGVMLRDPGAAYKFGRSTAREGGLLKVKRFEDSEATITGFIEQMRNENEALTDAFGHTKRSSHRENKVGKGTLGAISVEDVHSGEEFEIGTGFTDELRQSIWDTQGILMGQVVKYRHFPIGVKTKPRFPVFAGFRNPIDF